jgi:hypothetical protein
LLKKSTKEVVKVFDVSDEGDNVVADQLPGAYIGREEWLSVRRACEESGGEAWKNDETGHWFFSFPKAAAQSSQGTTTKAPNHGPGPGEAAAAGQPQAHNVDNVSKVSNVAKTPTPSPSEWKPEFPAKDAPSPILNNQTVVTEPEPHKNTTKEHQDMIRAAVETLKEGGYTDFQIESKLPGGGWYVSKPDIFCKRGEEKVIVECERLNEYKPVVPGYKNIIVLPSWFLGYHEIWFCWKGKIVKLCQVPDIEGDKTV